MTSDESKYQEVVLIPGNTANGTVITSVVPADFDGDNQMDILVTRQLKDVTGVRVQIYWGHRQQTRLGMNLIMLISLFSFEFYGFEN